MHYLGFLGVPRRYYELGEAAFISPNVHTLNAFITVMALIVGAAQMLFIYNIVSSLIRGEKRVRQSLAGHHARMADGGNASGSRQFRQGTADRLSLGL